MAMRPTFWLKEVMGMQPKREDRLEMKPSTAMAPDTSLFVGVRPKPMAARALVSPSVSVADTRKIRKIEKMASAWNSRGTGMIAGRERTDTWVILDRFTMP